MNFGPKNKDYYTGFSIRTFLNLQELRQKVDASFNNFDLLDAAVFWETNSEREKHGLKPFMFNVKLREMATLHSNQMRLHHFFSHENQYEARYKTLEDRLDSVKDSFFLGFMTFGENIALFPTLKGSDKFSIEFVNGTPRFYDTLGHELFIYTCLEYAHSVVEGWMNSPGHRANILNPTYEYLGCGCAGFERTDNNISLLYFNLTQNFGGDIILSSSTHIQRTINPRAANPSNNNMFNASLGDWGHNNIKTMADISLILANTGETTPVNGVDLETVTNTVLLQAAVDENTFPAPKDGYEYRLVGKDGKPIAGQKTLAELGFSDGDTIKVLEVAQGA